MKKAVFDKLIRNETMKKINELCKEAGLYELHLYHNKYEENSEKVFFFAKSVGDDVDLFLLASKEEEIADILKIDSEQVMLTPLDRIAPEFRQSAKTFSQPYEKTNKMALCEWYEHDGKSENPSSFLQSSNSQKKPMPNGLWTNGRKRKGGEKLSEKPLKKNKLTTLNGVASDIVGCLKKEGLWDELLNCPDVLLDIQATIQEEKGTSKSISISE